MTHWERFAKLCDPNIRAHVVYDGETLRVPDELLPTGDRDQAIAKVLAKDQLQGSDRERVCELAGRTCYDSLGQGRNSTEYWEHIRQVKHLSVIEHAYFTLRTGMPSDPFALMALMNRKGVWATYKAGTIRVTVNLRAILEWDKWTEKIAPKGLRGSALSQDIDFFSGIWRDSIYQSIQPKVPLILPKREESDQESHLFDIVEPETAYERHISMYLSMGRTGSHEQVRHRENMSQRSTRYCDEDASPWIQHPLAAAYFEETGDNTLRSNHGVVQDHARSSYKTAVAKLQAWLIAKGVDKQTARKQARGAARGDLGNSLMTEMIFTTSIDGWKEIIRQRLNGAADAEIRFLYAKVLDALKASIHKHDFLKMHLFPAKDGLGFELKEE